MESSFDFMLFPVDQFVTYSVITINNEENVILSIASRIFCTPSGAGTELCVDYILSFTVYVYMCVCIFFIKKRALLAKYRNW